MVILHDGQFTSLLSAIYDAYYVYKHDCTIFQDTDYTPDLLEETVMVFTQSDKADKVAKSIVTKLGKEVFEHLLYAFYAEDKESSNSIYQFLKYAFVKGPDVIQYRSHPQVNPMLKHYQRVTREGHRMLGLIRFVEMETGLLVSQFESDTFLLPLLSSHFLNRMTNENWMLHDLKRGLASVCNGTTWSIIELDSTDMLKLSNNELHYQELWQIYFVHIAIKERKNSKLQSQMMPKKYWKYLIENPI